VRLPYDLAQIKGMEFSGRPLSPDWCWLRSNGFVVVTENGPGGNDFFSGVGWFPDRHRGLARRAHYLEVAVPNSTLIRGAFENGLVKCAALRGLASDVSCDAAEVILGKVPVDQVLHVWILVPPIHAAIRLFIPLAMDAFFDQVLDPHQTI